MAWKFNPFTKKLDYSANIVGVYQPIDAALTNISALAYVSPSFIKFTAEDTYAVRTLAQTVSDLSGEASGAFSFNSQDVTAIKDLTTSGNVDYRAVTESHKAEVGDDVWWIWKYTWDATPSCTRVEGPLLGSWTGRAALAWA